MVKTTAAGPLLPTQNALQICRRKIAGTCGNHLTNPSEVEKGVPLILQKLAAEINRDSSS
eukprot:JP436293.1.p3 GENE.JP436293.1~~JP436293.1.p3  ORF type:complete len:60 (+),score=1.39 JP436293.1:342-521(+)